MKPHFIEDEIENAFELSRSELHALFTDFDLTPAQWRLVFRYFASEAYTQFIDSLLSSGMNPHNVDQSEWGALGICKYKFPLLKYLLAQGIDVNELSFVNEEEKSEGETLLDDLADACHCVNFTAEREMMDAIFDFVRERGGKYQDELDGVDP
jgi:hypothetical protein